MSLPSGNLVYDSDLRSSNAGITYGTSGLVTRLVSYVPLGTVTSVITYSGDDVSQVQSSLNGEVYETLVMTNGTSGITAVTVI